MKTLFTFDDPGKDTDDSVNARLRAKFIKSGKLEMIGSIACMYPAQKRAELLSSIYHHEGVQVDVMRGSNFCSDLEPHAYEFTLEPCHPIAFNTNVPIAVNLDDAQPKSVSLVICSGLFDVWIWLNNFPSLIKDKVCEVYIMGGALWGEDQMIADPTATNNKFCESSVPAQTVYDWFIDNGIPVKVLSRHAAYAVPLPKTFYQSLDGKVGAYLASVFRAQNQEFWNYFSSNPIEHRQNRYSFAKNFCGLDDLPIATGEDPWIYISGTIAYDPLTTLYAVYPALFEPSCKTIRGVECEIVGLSAEETGIPNRFMVADCLIQSVM